MTEKNFHKKQHLDAANVIAAARIEHQCALNEKCRRKFESLSPPEQTQMIQKSRIATWTKLKENLDKIKSEVTDQRHFNNTHTVTNEDII